MKQNKKGFTLIELLAVIVILAIIALIAVPVIMNIISSARKSAFEDTAYGLINAGEMYYASALLNDGITGTKTFEFTEGGNIPEGLNVKGDMPKSGVLEVTKDGKTALAITNGDLCIIKGYNDSKIQVLEEFETCELPAKTLSELARKNDFAESINACATSGTCAVGTKFALEVAPGNIQNFYVVSDTNNKVTLIMDRNIGEPVEWTNKDDYIAAGGTEDGFGGSGANDKGPITVLNYLENQTANWTNIEVKNYTLTDSQYGTMTRTNARARMLTLTEANAIIEYSWSYANLNESVIAYWTSSSDTGTSDYVMFVTTYGYVNSDMAGNTNGVRPVIELSK